MWFFNIATFFTSREFYLRHILPYIIIFILYHVIKMRSGFMIIMTIGFYEIKTQIRFVLNDPLKIMNLRAC